MGLVNKNDSERISSLSTAWFSLLCTIYLSADLIGYSIDDVIMQTFYNYLDRSCVLPMQHFRRCTLIGQFCDAFYMQPVKKLPSDPYQAWFKNMPVGVNPLENMRASGIHGKRKREQKQEKIAIKASDIQGIGIGHCTKPGQVSKPDRSLRSAGCSYGIT